MNQKSAAGSGGIVGASLEWAREYEWQDNKESMRVIIADV